MPRASSAWRRAGWMPPAGRHRRLPRHLVVDGADGRIRDRHAPPESARPPHSSDCFDASANSRENSGNPSDKLIVVVGRAIVFSSPFSGFAFSSLPYTESACETTAGRNVVACRRGRGVRPQDSPPSMLFASKCTYAVNTALRIFALALLLACYPRTGTCEASCPGFSAAIWCCSEISPFTSGVGRTPGEGLGRVPWNQPRGYRRQPGKLEHFPSPRVFRRPRTSSP